MLNFIKNFFVEDIKPPEDDNLFDSILRLKLRIDELEKENIELTNALYEMENRLQSKIDNIHPVVYNLESKGISDYSLGDS
jgi:chaperonin cofactor prefoldin